MRQLKLLFLPYVGLALFSGIAIGGHHLDLKGSIILAAIHVALIAFAIFAAYMSKVHRDKPQESFKIYWRLPLSISGWYISLALVYTVFFLVGLHYAA